jgi:hypothetical protein
LVTPLIDLTEIDAGCRVDLSFSYHMHGLHIGNLKVQASRYRNFSRGVKDLVVQWPTFQGTTIAGQQHLNSSDSFSNATVSTEASSGAGLLDFIGKRFYIRFLYTAGITHLGDIAIDSITIIKNPSGGSAPQDSFKLLHPTHDNVGRPYATMMRAEFAKRPVNIRNIHMTGSSPTQAGNFLDRYEYINTVSPEANDPWFVKNSSQIQSTTPELLRQGGSINQILRIFPGAERFRAGFKDFTLPDRSFLSGSVKNRTRIKTRFSSPGGFETLSRGYLDPAHETYSVYNEMNFRNLSARIILNTQLQAHQGKFGVSTHGPGSNSARIFGDEQTGTINSNNYSLAGDASRHKYHRNNIERIEFVGDDPLTLSTTFVTASSFDNAFVSHTIPRLDQQTRWITASII